MKNRELTEIGNFDIHGFAQMDQDGSLNRTLLYAVACWKEFCKLPSAVKETIGHSNDSAECGYEGKNGIGLDGDRKEKFDFKLGGSDYLFQCAPAGNKAVHNLLEASLLLPRLIESTFLRFADTCHKCFGPSITGQFRDLTGMSLANSYIRFIHHPPGYFTGNVLTPPHVAQGGIILHLYESAPGFQALSHKTHRWEDVDFAPEHSTVVGGMQLQLITGGILPALCHQVVCIPESASNGRFSVMASLQLLNTPVYDKKRWGPLQRFTPGFNYNHHPGLFRDYFFEP